MTRGEKKTGLIAVRLEPEIMTAIETEADREDRPTAAMARILIREALAARNKEIRKLTGIENRKARQVKMAKEES